MIVKNGEETLPYILDAIQENNVFDQVVVVDTGSTDGTIALLKKYPFVQIEHFEWTNDFSAARNVSLSYLTTTTFMWIDADDRPTPALLSAWKKLADELYESDFNSYLLPYHYAVNDFEEPIVKQFRERILANPKDWEWREPIHEVCCFKGDSVREVTLDEHPVVHKPVFDEYRANQRNWNILNASYLNNNDVSPRTLFYIQKEAMMRGQYEFAVTVAHLQKEKNSEKLAGWMLYEVAKQLGESYRELYFRTNDKAYYDKAETVLRGVIDQYPTFNEARCSLVDLYMRDKKPIQAMEVADTIVEDVPKVASAILLDKYGKYKQSLQAAIHLKGFKSPESAIHPHLECLEAGYLTPEVFENDKAIRKFIERGDIIVVYSDQDLLDSAQALKQYLLDNRIAKKVIVSTNPIVKSFAVDVYYHLTASEDTLYKDETPTKTHKIALWFADESPKAVYGWNAFVMVQGSLADCDLDGMMESFTSAPLLIEGFDSPMAVMRQVRAGKRSWFVALTDDAFDMLTDGSAKVTFYVNKKNELVGVTGPTERFVEFGADKECFYVNGAPNTDGVATDYRVVPVEGEAKGIPFKIKVPRKKEKSIAFYAGGIESWDGLTPYQDGIGGSESSLIFAAEELANKGYDVTVFCPAAKEITVGNVNYVPSSLYDGQGGFDVFVSSRVPDALKTRHAPKQYLWMHDTMDAYTWRFKPEQKIDGYICISEWQRATAIEIGIAEDKIITIPNAIHDYFPRTNEERNRKRGVWLSSPDRGLHNVIKLQKECDEIFEDYWVLYSWHNINVVNADNFYVFCRSIKEKNYLRKKGVKLAGRLPIDEVKELLQTTGFVMYPSSFEETFCISAMEALINGSTLLCNRNGATYETVKKTACPKSVSWEMPTGSEMFEEDDMAVWIKAFQTYVPSQKVLEPLKLKPNATWKEVGDIWEQELLR